MRYMLQVIQILQNDDYCYKCEFHETVLSGFAAPVPKQPFSARAEEEPASALLPLLWCDAHAAIGQPRANSMSLSETSSTPRGRILYLGTEF